MLRSQYNRISIGKSNLQGLSLAPDSIKAKLLINNKYLYSMKTTSNNKLMRAQVAHRNALIELKALNARFIQGEVFLEDVEDQEILVRAAYLHEADMEAYHREG